MCVQTESVYPDSVLFLTFPIVSRTHADSAKPTPSETDCNDNVPSHKTPASSQSKHGMNGFFQQQMLYDCPPSRAPSVSVDSSLYNLPRSYSHDVLPKESPSSTDADGELYVFNTLSGASSVEAQDETCIYQLRHSANTWEHLPDSTDISRRHLGTVIKAGHHS